MIRFSFVIIILLIGGLTYLLQEPNNPAVVVLRQPLLWPELTILFVLLILLMRNLRTIRKREDLSPVLAIIILAYCLVFFALYIVSLFPALLVFENDGLFRYPMQAQATVRYALFLALLILLCRYFSNSRFRQKPLATTTTEYNNAGISTSEKISHVLSVISLVVGTVLTVTSSSPLITKYYQKPSLAFSKPLYVDDAMMFAVANQGNARAENVVIQLSLLDNESVSVVALGTEYTEEVVPKLPKFDQSETTEHLVKVPILEPGRPPILIHVSKGKTVQSNPDRFSSKYTSMHLVSVSCSTMKGIEKDISAIVVKKQNQELWASMRDYVPPGKAIISRNTFTSPTLKLEVIYINQEYSADINAWVRGIVERIPGSFDMGQGNVLTIDQKQLVVGTLDGWTDAFGRLVVARHSGLGLLMEKKKYILTIIADLTPANDLKLRLLKEITDKEGVELLILSKK